MKVLITGGIHGIGNGLAKIFAGLDHQSHEVIILDRSKELGIATIKELKSITKNSKISFVLCDLAKLSDVRKGIKEIHSQHEFLDGLFINAGLGYAAKRIETEDGMDSHFQVNYLSQFMLTLNLLDLLGKSEKGGRVIFNVFEGKNIFWDDLQMKQEWGYEKGINQGMVAKRMFYLKLHQIYKQDKKPKVSFFGFQVPNTVWTNQVNIIPVYMKVMASIVKFFGGFITIEKCGLIISPLLTEKQEESMNKSGKLIAWENNKFVELEEDPVVLNPDMQDRLWRTSLELCRNEKTTQIANDLSSHS